MSEHDNRLAVLTEGQTQIVQERRYKALLDELRSVLAEASPNLTAYEGRQRRVSAHA